MPVMPSAQRVGVGALLGLVTLLGVATYFEALPQNLSLDSSTGVVATRDKLPRQREYNSSSHRIEKRVSDSKPVAPSSTSIQSNTSTNINNSTITLPEIRQVDQQNRSIVNGAATTTSSSPSSVDRHVISWMGVSALDTMIVRYWKGNLFCEEIQAARQQHNNSNLPISVNISFGCHELYSASDMGSGNFISALYHMRMSALALGNVDLHVTCPDADQVQSQLILPWFMGHYWGSTNQQQPQWTVESTCGNYDTSPISHMYERMQYAMRRMAIGLVGLPMKDPHHPAHQWAEEHLWPPKNENNNNVVSDTDLQLPVPQKDATPPFPAESLELDDATIHFRCGGAFVFDFLVFCWSDGPWTLSCSG